MRESKIEQYLVDRVKEIGGVAYKFKSPSHNKVPDRLVLIPSIDLPEDENFPMTMSIHIPARVVFVETKPEGEAATFPKNAHERGQLREHKRIRAIGHRVEVIDSKEGVDEFIREFTA